MTEELPVMLERCAVPLPGNLDPNRSIVVVSETHDGVLSEKQRVDLPRPAGAGPLRAVERRKVAN
jgi:hypothetical protein